MLSMQFIMQALEQSSEKCLIVCADSHDHPVYATWPIRAVVTYWSDSQRSEAYSKLAVVSDCFEVI